MWEGQIQQFRPVIKKSMPKSVSTMAARYCKQPFAKKPRLQQEIPNIVVCKLGHPFAQIGQINNPIPQTVIRIRSEILWKLGIIQVCSSLLDMMKIFFSVSDSKIWIYLIFSIVQLSASVLLNALEFDEFFQF